jgi:hypothetical protein
LTCLPLAARQLPEPVTAVVVVKQGAVVDEVTLIEHTRALLAPFKVPKRVFCVDDLPRNTAGKLLKRVLRDRFAKAEQEWLARAGRAHRSGYPWPRRGALSVADIVGRFVSLDALLGRIATQVIAHAGVAGVVVLAERLAR